MTCKLNLYVRGGGISLGFCFAFEFDLFSHSYVTSLRNFQLVTIVVHPDSFPSTPPTLSPSSANLYGSRQPGRSLNKDGCLHSFVSGGSLEVAAESQLRPISHSHVRS